jgi:hypothetical protein
MTRQRDEREGETARVTDGGVERSLDPGVERSVDSGRADLGGIGSPLRDAIRLLRGETRHIELWSRIATLRAELDTIEETLPDGETDGATVDRIRVVRGLLDDAHDQLRRGRVEEAWGQYHGASRLVVFVYDAVGDDESVAARARAVYEDAQDALTGAPRRTVVALLTEGESVKSPPEPAALAEAMRVLHDQYERVALTRRYLQSQFNQLLLQGCVSIVLLFGLAIAAELVAVRYPNSVLVESELLVSPLMATDLRTIGFALYVVLVGIVGASVFGMRTLRDLPLSTRATRRTPGLFITGARVFVGATSALFLVFVLFTGLLNVQSVTAPMALAVAFAAGYSERLAPQAVETVSQVIPSRPDADDGTDGQTAGDRER